MVPFPSAFEYPHRAPKEEIGFIFFSCCFRLRKDDDDPVGEFLFLFFFRGVV